MAAFRSVASAFLINSILRFVSASGLDVDTLLYSQPTREMTSYATDTIMFALN